jgi:hypothetical protein
MALPPDVDDWHQREPSEAQLVRMGPGIVGVLRQLKNDNTTPAEAQHLIEVILNTLVQPGKKSPDAATGAPADVNKN